MAKLIGTGKDPLGQYGEGLVFDVPLGELHYDELIAKGYATPQAPEDHDGRTDTQIANSMVRGDALLDPVEQAAAERIGDRAHDIVRQQDPDAAYTPTDGVTPEPLQVADGDTGKETTAPKRRTRTKKPPTTGAPKTQEQTAAEQKAHGAKTVSEQKDSKDEK